jgi:prepilin-type N-terminal cleavage/methylation domain-containing protein
MVRRSSKDAGITLLEMLVVLAVIALLAMGLSAGYARLPSTALKKEAVRLAAFARTAYDRATASGAHHRLVLSFEDGTYFIERCEGKVQVRKVRDLHEEVERKRLEAEKQAVVANLQNAQSLLHTMVSDAGQKLGGASGSAGATCEPVHGEMGKKQKLGGRPKVSFVRVHVAHLEEPADSGEVTLNFFPLGTAERAVIELGAGENAEDRFSIVVRPLSGRVELRPGEWRDAEEMVKEDAEGGQQ